MTVSCAVIVTLLWLVTEIESDAGTHTHSQWREVLEQITGLMVLSPHSVGMTWPDSGRQIRMNFPPPPQPPELQDSKGQLHSNDNSFRNYEADICGIWTVCMKYVLEEQVIPVAQSKPEEMKKILLKFIETIMGVFTNLKWKIFGKVNICVHCKHRELRL